MVPRRKMRTVPFRPLRNERRLNKSNIVPVLDVLTSLNESRISLVRRSRNHLTFRVEDSKVDKPSSAVEFGVYRVNAVVIWIALFRWHGSSCRATIQLPIRQAAMT